MLDRRRVSGQVQSNEDGRMDWLFVNVKLLMGGMLLLGVALGMGAASCWEIATGHVGEANASTLVTSATPTLTSSTSRTVPGKKISSSSPEKAEKAPMSAAALDLMEKRVFCILFVPHHNQSVRASAAAWMQ